MRVPRSNKVDPVDDDLDDESNEPLASHHDGDDGGGAPLLDDDLAARMRPSKTQLKKQSHELQALGEALVGLPDSRIAPLGLSETLLTAINDYRRSRSHEGRRRQMQYIGKLMRHTDPEPIREAVAAMQLGSAKETLQLHRVERLRAELIEQDDALTRWLETYPQTDSQQLRSLIRAARKDAAQSPEKRSGKAYRELFQFIKQQLAEGTDLPDSDRAPDFNPGNEA